MDEKEFHKAMSVLSIKTAAQRKIIAEAGAEIARLELESAELVGKMHGAE